MNTLSFHCTGNVRAWLYIQKDFHLPRTWTRILWVTRQLILPKLHCILLTSVSTTFTKGINPVTLPPTSVIIPLWLSHIYPSRNSSLTTIVYLSWVSMKSESMNVITKHLNLRHLCYKAVWILTVLKKCYLSSTWDICFKAVCIMTVLKKCYLSSIWDICVTRQCEYWLCWKSAILVQSETSVLIQGSVYTDCAEKVLS